MKKLLFSLLFLTSVSMGVFIGIQQLRASTPTVSGGESPASVYYDETWKATNAVVSSYNKATDRSRFTEVNPATKNATGVAAHVKNPSPGVQVYPKMVVTRWTVHGHIHFQ